MAEPVFVIGGHGNNIWTEFTNLDEVAAFMQLTGDEIMRFLSSRIGARRIGANRLVGPHDRLMRQLLSEIM